MEKKKRRFGWIRKILIALLIIFIAIQFIHPSKNNGEAFGPNDITHVVAVPDTVKHLLVVACYDCHSNHTNYPWYSYINPVGWWLNDHINEGKRGLNFTKFKSYTLKKQKHRLNDIAELTGKGYMPLKSYLWIHDEAKLSEEQKKMIIDWANTEEFRIDSLKK